MKVNYIVHGDNLLSDIKISEEEIRKIQFTGRASYIISLPKRWILQKGLRRGDQMAIRLQEDSFVLTPHITRTEVNPKEVAIMVFKANDPPTIVRKMISLYLVGYEIVHIKSKEGPLTAAQLSAIKDTVHNTFIGTEIISESAEEITFQILSGLNRFSVEHALRRIVSITSYMGKELALALKNRDEEKAKNIISFDDEIDRFSFYIIRQLKSSIHDERLVKNMGLKKQKECLGCRLETKNVEWIADSLVNIANHLLNLRTQKINNLILQKISELIKLLINLFENVMTAHFKRDFNLAEKAILRFIKVEPNISKTRHIILNSKLISLEKLELMGIIENIKQITNYCIGIGEVLLNKTIEESKSIKVEF